MNVLECKVQKYTRRSNICVVFQGFIEQHNACMDVSRLFTLSIFDGQLINVVIEHAIFTQTQLNYIHR